jgi:hypothetical protein
MGSTQIAEMTDKNSRVIVVRAWRDGSRVLARVLVGDGSTAAPHEHVFADNASVCRRIRAVLDELELRPPSAELPETKC